MSAYSIDYYTSIALDSSDKVHISYFFSSGSYGTLKYATNVAGSWTTTTVDSVGGLYTDIAIDSSDKIHISYYDNDNSDLKYATNASGSWVTTTVDSNGYTGYNSSIAFDTSGKVYISYFSADDEGENATLKYATNASGSWVTTVVDSDADSCYFSSIAVDKSDKVHITYYNENYGGDLRYITNKSGSWVRKIIDNGRSVDQDGIAGMDNSITLDSSDKVHISYYAIYYKNTGESGDGTSYGKDFSAIKYVTNAKGSWVKKTIDKLRTVRTLYSGEKIVYTSIALDTSDKVHISYYDKDKGTLKHATNAARK